MKASQDLDAQKAFVLRQGPTAFRWLTSTGRLDQPGDLLQLEEEVRGAAAA